MSASLVLVVAILAAAEDLNDGLWLNNNEAGFEHRERTEAGISGFNNFVTVTAIGSLLCI